MSDEKARLWDAAWNAYRDQYNHFRDENPHSWRAYFTAHHGSALDAALRAYDEARGLVLLTEDEAAVSEDDAAREARRNAHAALSYESARDGTDDESNFFLPSRSASETSPATNVGASDPTSNDEGPSVGCAAENCVQRRPASETSEHRKEEL